MWVLTKGVEAKEVSELVTPTYDNFLPRARPPGDSVQLPILSSVLSTVVTPALTVLSFHQLSSFSTPGVIQRAHRYGILPATRSLL